MSARARHECFHGDAGASLHLGLACAPDDQQQRSAALRWLLLLARKRVGRRSCLDVCPGPEAAVPVAEHPVREWIGTSGTWWGLATCHRQSIARYRTASAKP